MKPDDKRRSCKCGHTHRDHGPAHGTTDVFGGKCLAFVTDWGDELSASKTTMCTCTEWEPWELHDARAALRGQPETPGGTAE